MCYCVFSANRGKALKGVHVYSHGLLIELVSDPSRHVFEDSDTARHQLQLLILLLHDQLHTHTPVTSKDTYISLLKIFHNPSTNLNLILA